MLFTQFIDFGIFLILLGLFLFIIFSQSLSKLHRVYIFLHLLFMHWALLQFAAKATDVLNFKFVIVQTSYLVLSTISVVFYIFSIYIINKTSWFKSWKFKVTLIPAILTFIFVLFNPKYLFIQKQSGLSIYKVMEQGPLFNVMTVVSFSYVFVVFCLLIHSYRKQALATTTQKHISFTLIGLGINVFFALLDLFYNIIFTDSFNQYFPLMSIGMLFSASYMTFKINKSNVLNIISLAHRDVVNTLSVGILVVDRDSYIVELNRHIYNVIDLKVGDRFNIDYIKQQFPHNDWDTIIKLYDAQRLDVSNVFTHELALTLNPARYAAVKCQPIIDGTNTLLGYMYTVQDITKMKNLIENTKLHNVLLQQRNAELIQTQEELYEANKKLEKIANTDPLTECYNRRYLIKALEKLLPNNIANRIPFSVVIIDLDHFKSVNDRFGHLAGDYLLKYTANIIKKCIGPSDILARFGGEEFIIYFHNISKLEAQILIQNIKEEIENNVIWLEDTNESVGVTVSIGVVSIDEFDKFIGFKSKNLQREIVALADHALYEAKHQGRNTIVKRDFVVGDR